MTLEDELNELYAKLQSLYHKVSDDCLAKEDLRVAISALNDVRYIWSDEE